MRRVAPVAGWLVWPLLGLVAYVLWPTRLGGDTTFVVVRGTSMEPKYHTGDLVVARAQDSYEVGDIVVFRVPAAGGEGQLVIHRVVDIGPDGSVVTQGDNRDTPDAFALQLSDIVGSPVVNIAMGGAVLAVLSTWWFLAMVVGLCVVWRLWPQPAATERAACETPPPADDLEWFTSVMGGDIGERDFELWMGDLDTAA